MLSFSVATFSLDSRASIVDSDFATSFSVRCSNLSIVSFVIVPFSTSLFNSSNIEICFLSPSFAISNFFSASPIFLFTSRNSFVKFEIVLSLNSLSFIVFCAFFISADIFVCCAFKSFISFDTSNSKVPFPTLCSKFNGSLLLNSSKPFILLFIKSKNCVLLLICPSFVPILFLLIR